jgi:diguanylate cyclase (GGDEF)-like protein
MEYQRSQNSPVDNPRFYIQDMDTLTRPKLKDILNVIQLAQHAETPESLTTQWHLEWAICYARWIFIVVPFLTIFWKVPNRFVFTFFLTSVLVAFNLVIQALLTKKPYFIMRHTLLIRIGELLVSGICITWVHILIGSFDYNLFYGLFLPLGALTGGINRIKQIGLTTLIFMGISNCIVVFLHPERLIISYGVLNMLVDASILFFMAFVILFMLGWERETARYAHTDVLTGLWNRRAFFPTLKQLTALAKRQGTPLSVIMCDVDHFKEVNDRYGHAKGDIILQELGQCIYNMLRMQDCAARIGGEEFAIILPNTSLAGAMEVATRLHKTCALHRIPHGLRFTVSLGVAELDNEKDTPETLLDKADQALYQAKKEGRNCTKAWHPSA